ncbi:MAG: glycosyltransferase family 4 protein [Nitrospirota bacterium]
MRVLISAYECSPTSSSEAEVGWQWVSHLSEFHEIVVITKRHSSSQNTLKLIEGNKNIRFEYYDLPKIFDFMRTGDLRHFIYYNLWQIGAYFRARKIVKNEKFDLVHHLVYVNTWQPTYMAFLGIPFIFGPIGENPKIPYQIIKHYGIKVILREFVGRFIKSASINLSPLMRLIYHKAAKIIAINNDVYKKIRKGFRHKTKLCPAIGINEMELSPINVHKKRVMILYVGRFVYIKSPDLALLAFLSFVAQHDDVELIMIGGGKLESKLKEIIQSSADKHKVKLLGWIDRKEVMEYMKKCDVFLFPTFEGGGMVVLEVMSYGKPIICMDFGGPKDFLTEECGIKVPVTNRTQIIDDLSEALEKLYIHQDLRREMGIAARKRIEENYTWDKKTEWMNQVYIDTLGE